jgi:ATPase subunit of ABC transporter with duplicated ATPase domains
LAGANGAGKSQLIQLLYRATLMNVPKVSVSPTVAVGYLHQPMPQLSTVQSVFYSVNISFCLGDRRSVSVLAGAGFGVATHRRAIADLSPGQRA